MDATRYAPAIVAAYTTRRMWESRDHRHTRRISRRIVDVAGADATSFPQPLAKHVGYRVALRLQHLSPSALAESMTEISDDTGAISVSVPELWRWGYGEPVTLESGDRLATLHAGESDRRRRGNRADRGPRELLVRHPLPSRTTSGDVRRDRHRSAREHRRTRRDPAIASDSQCREVATVGGRLRRGDMKLMAGTMNATLRTPVPCRVILVRRCCRSRICVEQHAAGCVIGVRPL